MSFFVGINVSAVHNGWNLVTCPGSSQKCWSYYKNNVEKKRLSKMVIIHSGWPGRPDNSLATLKGLKEGGYYALSADVHFTKDDVPVLSHDATINRMAGTVSNPSADLNGSSPINISSLTLSEINAKYVFPRDRNRKYLSSYANNKITKFEDAVKYCHDNGLTMEVELKAGNGKQVKIVLDIVKKYNMNGSILWTSFHDYLFFAINDNTTGQLMQFFGPDMTDQQARDFYNNNKSKLANRNTYIVSSNDGAYVVPLEMNQISQYPQSKYAIKIEQPTPPKTVEVTGITLSVTDIKMKVGKQLNLKSRMTITPSNATNKTVTWSSSNSSVATVSKDGLVTTKAAGTATITVKSNNGKTATCKITVTNPSTSTPVEVTGIRFKNTSIKMNVGKSMSLKSNIVISPSNATNKNVTWSSNNPSVVQVTNDGVVTSKSVGTAVITVRTNNGKTATTTINVTTGSIEVKGVSLEIKSAKLSIGKNLNLKSRMKISPSNATNKTVTWSSSNPNVASVNKDGIVTTKSAGTAIITVRTNNGKTATCNITVTRIDNIQLTIVPSVIYLPIYDGTEYSQIKVNAKTTNNGVTVSANYDWSEIKNNYNIIGDIKRESNNSESIVISSVDGGTGDKCKKETYYVEVKYPSTTIANSIIICTYGGKWQKTTGVYQFESSQKSRKEMLTKEGCYAYEDLDTNQSNNSVYIYKTRYDRCSNSIIDSDSPIKLAIILVIIFVVIFGIPLLFKSKKKEVKRIKY